MGEICSSCFYANCFFFNLMSVSLKQIFPSVYFVESLVEMFVSLRIFASCCSLLSTRNTPEIHLWIYCMCYELYFKMSFSKMAFCAGWHCSVDHHWWGCHCGPPVNRLEIYIVWTLSCAVPNVRLKLQSLNWWHFMARCQAVLDVNDW